MIRATPLRSLSAPDGSTSQFASDLEVVSKAPDTAGKYFSDSQALSTLTELQLSNSSAEIAANPPQRPLDLDPKLIEKSPVLQRWMSNPPDVAADIANDPSFRTRARLNYSSFPSIKHIAGLNVGVEDVRIDQTRLTASANYQTSLNGDQRTLGTNLHYYTRPLGSYINVAPIIGYQQLENSNYSTGGVNLGFRLLFVLSRSGGTDVTLTQTWVAPGSDQEAGLFNLSFGYALTRQLRLSTELERQNTKRSKDNRFGIGIEWML